MKTKLTRFFLLAAAVFMSVSVSAATINLTGTIRDFSSAHPDMEMALGSFPVVTGIVETNLGVDGNPVFLNGQGVVTSATTFNQWYNDVIGVNQSMSYSITLDNTITADPNVYTYVNNSFFPIDGLLLGNEGRAHNYHFTYELSSSFTYQGGEDFSFTGDDDIWLFINDQLVIDLGGVHASATGSVDLDTLGLTVGQDYSFNLFFAERHTTKSNFRIDTSIKLNDPEVPEPATMLLFLSGILSLFGLSFFKKK